MRQLIKMSGFLSILCSQFIVIKPINAASPNPARQEVLLNMLKHDCGSCHGLTLKGGLGPSLLAKDLQHKSTDTLVQTIQQGKPGTPMPPWADFLSTAESYWLIDLLRSPKNK